MPTVYGSGADLQNAKSTLGSGYNFVDIGNAKQGQYTAGKGDLVVGGSAVTGGVNQGNATRLGGADRYATADLISNYAKSNTSSSSNSGGGGGGGGSNLTSSSNPNTYSATRNVYGSSTDLQNARNILGSGYNYIDIGNAQPGQYTAGNNDIVVGGNAVTPGVNQGNAQRLWGADAAGTKDAITKFANTDQINQQYAALQAAQTAQLYNKYNQMSADINNQIGQTNTNYNNLMNTYNSQLGDTNTKYTNMFNDLNTQKTSDVNAENLLRKQGDQGYFDQSNQVAAQNNIQGNRIQQWMAQHNLQQSGENVDAMLQGQSDLNNGLWKVNQAQNNFDNTSTQKINDLYNTYASKYASDQAQQQAELNTINNNISAAQNNRTTELQKLQAQLAGYGGAQANDLQSITANLDAQKAAALQKYNETVQAQQFQAQQAELQRQAAMDQLAKQEAYQSQQAELQRQFQSSQQAAQLANQLQIAELSRQAAAARSYGYGSSGYGSSSSQRAAATSQQNQVDKAAYDNFQSLSSPQDQYAFLSNKDLVNQVSSSMYKTLQSLYSKSLKDSGLSQSLVTSSQPTWDYSNSGASIYSGGR